MYIDANIFVLAVVDKNKIGEMARSFLSEIKDGKRS